MLRSLFENTKPKSAKKRRRNFWIYSVGEFVLIILGILIALQIDNWNQERQDRRLERVLLSEMHSNLKADLESIEFNSMMQQRYLNSNQIVLNFLQSDLPWHDSLGRHFMQLMAGTEFDNNSSAYESMNSVGIDLVRNDSLRHQITLVYSARYNKVEAMQDLLFTYILDHLYPALRLNLRTIVPGEQTVPVNLDKLRLDSSFKEDLYMNLFMYGSSQRIYSSARKEIIKLMEAIEKELS